MVKDFLPNDSLEEQAFQFDIQRFDDDDDDSNATVYSFTVNSKPVKVFVKNDAIYKVVADSNQIGSSAGTYTVDNQQLIVSYADNKLSAETAQFSTPGTSISEIHYTVGDTAVTVKNATPSPTTATVDGHTADLTYDNNAKQLNATYSNNSYNIKLLNEDVITVTVENNAIANVPTESEDNDIVPQDAAHGRYTVRTGGGGGDSGGGDDDDDDPTSHHYDPLDADDDDDSGGFDRNEDGTQNYTLVLNYDVAEKKFTAQAEISPHLQNAGKAYFLKIVDETIELTEDGGKLYRDGKELTNNNGVYTVEASNGVEVDLAYDANGKLVFAKEKTPEAKVGVDLAGSSGDVVANDGDMLTGTLKAGCKVTIPKDATVILKDVTIDASTGTRKSAAGIICEGNATIFLEGSITVGDNL